MIKEIIFQKSIGQSVLSPEQFQQSFTFELNDDLSEYQLFEFRLRNLTIKEDPANFTRRPDSDFECWSYLL